MEEYREKLEEMSHIDIRDVDKNTLKELDEIRVDQSLPVKERIKLLLDQVDNPYFYLDHGVIVKIGFSGSAGTLQECVEEYAKSQIHMRFGAH